MVHAILLSDLESSHETVENPIDRAPLLRQCSGVIPGLARGTAPTATVVDDTSMDTFESVDDRHTGHRNRLPRRAGANHPNATATPENRA